MTNRGLEQSKEFYLTVEPTCCLVLSVFSPLIFCWHCFYTAVHRRTKIFWQYIDVTSQNVLQHQFTRVSAVTDVEIMAVFTREKLYRQVSNNLLLARLAEEFTLLGQLLNNCVVVGNSIYQIYPDAPDRLNLIRSQCFSSMLTYFFAHSQGSHT